MTKNHPKPSELWKRINQNNLRKERIQDLENFKSNDVNFKIALWNPKTNGIRYLKALLYNLAASISPEAWKKISKMKNRNIGSPITVKYNDEEICLDYLQALFELEFIEKNIRLDGLSILEIGAGYGRTCHGIMSNHKIESYTIIDLENCLELSQKYLKSVLDYENFKKINFILVENVELLNSFNFDLCINIDSFAEMDAKVVEYYLDYINKHSEYLYVKNPVGKYMDKSLDNHSQGSELVELALSTGVLRDVIDIHDNKAVNKQVSRFIKTYQPGEKWECIANSWARPWSYYWQAMYKELNLKQEETRYVSKT